MEFSICASERKKEVIQYGDCGIEHEFFLLREELKLFSVKARGRKTTCGLRRCTGGVLYE